MAGMGNSRRILTFDLDGVLCRPPFGINPGKGLGKDRAEPGRKSILWRTESWRYFGRGPMPGAVEGFRELAQRYDCQVITARSDIVRKYTEAWFARNFGMVPLIHMRPHWRETPAQFKARKVRELGAFAHFEDDPHTAEWIAELVEHVFLVDWRRNRWLERDRITRIERIGEAIPVLAALEEASRTEGRAPGAS